MFRRLKHEHLLPLWGATIEKVGTTFVNLFTPLLALDGVKFLIKQESPSQKIRLDLGIKVGWLVVLKLVGVIKLCFRLARHSHFCTLTILSIET